MADRTYTGVIYKTIDNGTYYGDYWGDLVDRTNDVGIPVYPYYPSPTVDTVKTVEWENERKEDEMISKQDFLDALMDEGKSITPEQREVIREADDRKWKLFIARLLARVFEGADLEVLKEKPKEVLVKSKA